MEEYFTQFNPQILFRRLALFSMCFTIGANFIPPGFERTVCFILGCLGMLLAPLWEKQLFLTSLQLVALAGALSAILPISATVKPMLPLLISLLFMAHFYHIKILNNITNLIGAIGITVLGLGYAIQHPYIYLIGGITLFSYAFASYIQGIQIAIYWAILNAVFSIAVIYNILYFT